MLPQAPQLFRSTSRSTQAPPQGTRSPVQAAQTPLTQASPVEHLWPQAPQFCVSLVRSLQDITPNSERQQAWPLVQAWPHAPQFSEVSSVTQAPLQAD